MTGFGIGQGASNFCKSTKLGFFKGNSRLKLGVNSNFITQSKPLGGSTSPKPPPPWTKCLP
ncbi:MAG: hypothetical protein EWV40_13430 [Microcystis flos-aquae Mf_WU_F_19750830_S460]|uniref:Uncharacterized protein n=1 Tax=Microcystis flos-aquae Mf_WU_F_19750830_S460 TaxID=2486237 RepID=A0A552LJP4_9CHRO|nr:MAG: hypothetical protein EWV40_13430 [Microcystis flos-aquae Mf_WU_F_19750830_S460]